MEGAEAVAVFTGGGTSTEAGHSTYVRLEVTSSITGRRLELAGALPPMRELVMDFTFANRPATCERELSRITGRTASRTAVTRRMST